MDQLPSEQEISDEIQKEEEKQKKQQM